MLPVSIRHLARPLVVMLPILWISGWAPPADASCQTQYCQYRRAQGDLDREGELLRRLEQHPTDADALRQLLYVLEHKASSQVQAARWRERYRFEPEPVLVDPEAEARAALELERWRDVALDLEAGADFCRIGKTEVSEQALDKLRRRAADRPDSSTVARCYQQALAGLGRVDEAVDHADAFLAEHPDDPQAWANALAIRPDEAPGGRGQQLLERRAERLPTLEHRVELLRYYDQHGLRDLRDALVTALENEDVPLAEAETVCWALDQSYRQHEARLACQQRLYERSAGVEGVEDLRRSLRSTLLSHARNEKDWVTIEKLLADEPRDRLIYAWSTLVDWLPETACPRLIAAAEQLRALVPKDSFDAAYYPAERLAAMFQECSRNDLALAVVNPLLPSPAEDLESALKAARAQEAKAALDNPQGSSGYRLRHLAGPDSPLPLDDRLAVAQRRLDQLLEHDVPLMSALRQLIEVYEESDRFDQAIEQIRHLAEVRPEDAEIPLALGSAALRRKDAELVIEMADLVEQSPSANARQRAEASYLRGRVARWQGKTEQAVELLEPYFLLRQRFDPCGPCDSGLIALFVETENLTGLRRYLTLRHEAFKEFSRRHFEAAVLSEKSPYGRAQRRRILPISEENTLKFWVSEAENGSCESHMTLIDFEAEPGSAKELAPLCVWFHSDFDADKRLEQYEQEVLGLSEALTRVG